MKEILIAATVLFAVFFVWDLNTEADLIDGMFEAMWLFVQGCGCILHG